MFTRRDFLRRGGEAVILGAAIAGTGPAARVFATRAAGSVTLVAEGSEPPPEIKAMNQIFQLYTKKHPNVHITSQFTDYGTYTQKLSTQVAGGDVPDLMKSNLTIIPEYAPRGLLVDLDKYVPKTIDLSDVSKPAIAGNKVNGKLYGIPLDISTPALIYNSTLFDKAGVKMPQGLWTWEDYQSVCQKLAPLLPKGTYPTQDLSGDTFGAFEFYLRPHGKHWVNAAGHLAFNQKDLTNWWHLWENMRQKKLAPPAQVTAQINSNQPVTQLVVTGQAAMLEDLADRFTTYQGAMKDGLDMRTMPQGFAGQTLKQNTYQIAGDSFSIYSKSSAIKTALDVTKFVLTDPDAIQLYALAGGLVPATAAGRKAVLKSLTGDPTQTAFAKVLTYANAVAANPGPVAWQGAQQLQQLFLTTAQSVALGQVSISKGVSEFFAQAPSAIG